MDLGYKLLNDLTDKNYDVANKAGMDIINNSDIKAFEILNEKSEFIFDFIKEKILKILIKSVNQNNIINLFNFTKIYSIDFKDFVLQPLIISTNKEIEDKFKELIKNGTNEEKTYAIEYFTKIKNPIVLDFAKENIKSDFEPLKIASIKLLKEYQVQELYNLALDKLNNSNDDFEKYEAIEFLTTWGKKEAFDDIYKYYKQSNYNEYIASNLILLKDFNSLIKEDKEEEILNIYSSLLCAMPESISLDEIIFYLNDGLFNYLIELDSDYAILLNYYLSYKLNLILDNEAYSIDLTKEEKINGDKFRKNLNLILECFDQKEIINLFIGSKNINQNIIAKELDENLSNITL